MGDSRPPLGCTLHNVLPAPGAQGVQCNKDEQSRISWHPGRLPHPKQLGKSKTSKLKGLEAEAVALLAGYRSAHLCKQVPSVHLLPASRPDLAEVSTRASKLAACCASPSTSQTSANLSSPPTSGLQVPVGQPAPGTYSQLRKTGARSQAVAEQRNGALDSKKASGASHLPATTCERSATPGGPSTNPQRGISSCLTRASLQAEAEVCQDKIVGGDSGPNRRPSPLNSIYRPQSSSPLACKMSAQKEQQQCQDIPVRLSDIARNWNCKPSNAAQASALTKATPDAQADSQLAKTWKMKGRQHAATLAHLLSNASQCPHLQQHKAEATVGSHICSVLPVAALRASQKQLDRLAPEIDLPSHEQVLDVILDDPARLQENDMHSAAGGCTIAALHPGKSTNKGIQ